MLKRLAAITTAAALTAPPAAAVPIVGGSGLTPSAWALAEYVRATYPGVQSIGGVRACDAIGDHCRGVALDLMIGADMALGDAIYADLSGNMAAHSIKYCLWRVPSHFNHVHVTVF